MRAPLYVGAVAAAAVLWALAGRAAVVLLALTVGLVWWRLRGRRPGQVRRGRRRKVWTQEERDFILERDGRACVQCGATDDLQIDHIIPFSRGGACSLANVAVLCSACNLRKGAS